MGSIPICPNMLNKTQSQFDQVSSWIDSLKSYFLQRLSSEPEESGKRTTESSEVTQEAIRGYIDSISIHEIKLSLMALRGKMAFWRAMNWYLTDAEKFLLVSIDERLSSDRTASFELPDKVRSAMSRIAARNEVKCLHHEERLLDGLRQADE